MIESQIRDIAWKHPEQFGYQPGSHSVKSFKWGDAGGIGDIVIFPKTGPTIAIVEVKRAVSDEANTLVVGQLLKYYARALRMGMDGVQEIAASLAHGTDTRHASCSPARLWKRSEQAANDRCRQGRPLGPDDIDLHIVVDEAPERMQLRLVRTCQMLRKHHGLKIRLWRLTAKRNGIEPIPPPRVDESGRAYAGSQRQVQLCVNRYAEAFNREICAVAPELRGLEGAIRWVSPLAEDACREYRDIAALERLGLKRLAGRLREFWPSGGPQWDALATVRLTDGRPGIILVEAKSHVAELESTGSAAKDASSIRRIKAAVDEAKAAFGVPPEADWLGCYYQSGNRLALLHFFRRRARVPAWLVNVFFLNDPAPGRRTSREAWSTKIAELRRDLRYPQHGIPFAYDVFLESLADPWPSEQG